MCCSKGDWRYTRENPTLPALPWCKRGGSHWWPTRYLLSRLPFYIIFIGNWKCQIKCMGDLVFCCFFGRSWHKGCTFIPAIRLQGETGSLCHTWRGVCIKIFSLYKRKTNVSFVKRLRYCFPLPSLLTSKVHPKTPYPTVQLLHEDWKPVFSRSAPNIVKLDGSEVCRSSCIFEGIISSFCLYFVFNLAYPKHLKNTLIFLQKYIVKIDEGEDRPLPITVTRQINLLYWPPCLSHISAPNVAEEPLVWQSLFST